MAKDAIQLLKKDHQEVKSLLEELTETTERATTRRPELLEQIARLLKAHTTIEEKIFYPAFRKAAEEAGDDEGKTMYHEALEEHRTVDELVLPDLQKTDPKSEKFSGRAKVLKELVEHHADEEEKDMFPKAEKLLGAERLAELGEEMQARKNEMLSEKARA